MGWVIFVLPCSCDIASGKQLNTLLLSDGMMADAVVSTASVCGFYSTTPVLLSQTAVRNQSRFLHDVQASCEVREW